jgi:mycothiol synthase
VTPLADVTWRPLTGADLPAVGRLGSRVLAADGGFPLAAGEPLLRRRFVYEITTSSGGFVDGRLVAAAALRPFADGQIAAAGMVDPAWRGRGFGGLLLDWVLREASDTQIRVETESLTDEADALFRSRGLRQTFAEEVMRFDLRHDPPDAAMPTDVTLTAWSPDLAGRFYTVYEAAFRERPGFPGWPAPRWIEWISDDEDFAPEWTLLASNGDRDLGFVACARGAWIVQIGVVPAARGSGLGAGLTAEALRRMRAGSEVEALLTVNLDNPVATRVYERLGFTRIGRRARYERAD